MAARIPQARTVLRLNGFVSTAAGLLALAAVVPTAGSAFPLALGVAGLLLVYGFEAIALSVRRGLHRVHVLGFALTDLLLVAGGIVLLAVAPPTLTTAARALVAFAVSLVAGFLLVQVRAARTL